jgi:DNA-binding response OmpR family regulator
VKILMLEDDESISSVLREYLCDEAHGNECDSVSTIEKAIELVRANHYDVILADLMIGGRACVDFLDTARALQPEAHLCLMSAWPKSKDIAEAKKVDCFLPKPFDLDLIEQLLNRK